MTDEPATPATPAPAVRVPVDPEEAGRRRALLDAYTTMHKAKLGVRSAPPAVAEGVDDWDW